MYEKYVLKIDDVSIVLKYNLVENFVVIGGSMLHSRYIEKVITEYFEVELPENSHTQRNKVRYEFPYERTDFRQVQEQLEDDLILDMVKSHGRIM